MFKLIRLYNHFRDGRHHSRHDEDRRHRDDRGRGDRRERRESPGRGSADTKKSEKPEVDFAKKPTSIPPLPPGFIRAKPRKTTEEEVKAARQRFQARKAAGLTKPIIVLSDDEF